MKKNKVLIRINPTLKKDLKRLALELDKKVQDLEYEDLLRIEVRDKNGRKNDIFRF